MEDILKTVSEHFARFENLHMHYFRNEITLEEAREIVKEYTKNLLSDTSCEVFVSELMYIENDYNEYIAFDVAIINCLTREMQSVHIETE
jgi:hypothetical protein